MKIKASIRLACLLASTASMTHAQTSVDRSFTSVAKDCQGIQWSERALQMYPTIGAACQSVEERGGKTYVKFQGTVQRVADGGRELTVNFKGGGDITLSPPAETNFYLDGRKTPAAKLQRGDELNFYIAEDRLAAQFPQAAETEVATTRYVIVPIVAPAAGVERQGTRSEQLAATLPSTASSLPLLAMAGLFSLGLGASLTFRRRR
jgi:LPXTG-motif cell wall-anchored protein